MGSIHDVNIFGKMNFVDGVQVAWLALKHRRNKNGGQRIIVFVGSPVHEESKVRWPPAAAAPAAAAARRPA